MRMQILNVPCGCTFVLVCAHLCMHVLVLVAKSNTTNVTILSTPLKNTMHLSQNKNLSLSACCVGNNLRPFLIVRDASSHKINDVMTTRLTVVTGRNKVTAREGAEMIPGRSSTPRGGTRNGWMTEQRGKSSPKANPIAKWNITEEDDVLRSNAQNEANKAVVRMLNQPGAVVWIDHSQGHPFWHPLTDWGQSGCDKKQVRRKAGVTNSRRDESMCDKANVTAHHTPSCFIDVTSALTGSRHFSKVSPYMPRHSKLKAPKRSVENPVEFTVSQKHYASRIAELWRARAILD